MPTTPSGNCVTGDVRIAQAMKDQTQNTSTGTLQICINNAWGAVCHDDLFGVHDAEVACQQAGGYERQIIGQIASVAIGGPVFLSHLDCVGDEGTLLECPNAILGSVCEHEVAPFITCKGLCYYALPLLL